MNGYTAYIINREERDALLDIFRPEFSKIYAHHITNDFNVHADTPIPDLTSVELTHHITDGMGLECLVLRINDHTKRSNGQYFHITWSLDPTIRPPSYITDQCPDTEHYEPMHSNILIETAFGADCPAHIKIQELGRAPLPHQSFTATHILFKP